MKIDYIPDSPVELEPDYDKIIDELLEKYDDVLRENFTNEELVILKEYIK